MSAHTIKISFLKLHLHREYTKYVCPTEESIPELGSQVLFLYFKVHCNLGKSLFLLVTWASHFSSVIKWGVELVRGYSPNSRMPYGVKACALGVLNSPHPGNLYEKLPFCICEFFWRSLWLISNCHTSCGPKNNHSSCFIENLLCPRPFYINACKSHNNPLS